MAYNMNDWYNVSQDIDSRLESQGLDYDFVEQDDSGRYKNPIQILQRLVQEPDSADLAEQIWSQYVQNARTPWQYSAIFGWKTPPLLSKGSYGPNPEEVARFRDFYASMQQGHERARSALEMQQLQREAKYQKDNAEALNAREAFNNSPGNLRQYTTPEGQVRWGSETDRLLTPKERQEYLDYYQPNEQSPGASPRVGYRKPMISDLGPLDFAGSDTIETPRSWLRSDWERKLMGPNVDANIMAQKNAVAKQLNQKLAAIWDAQAGRKGKAAGVIPSDEAATEEGIRRSMSKFGMDQYAYSSPEQREKEEKDWQEKNKATLDAVRVALESKMGADNKTKKYNTWQIGQYIDEMAKNRGPTKNIPDSVIADLPPELQTPAMRPPEPTVSRQSWEQPGYGESPAMKMGRLAGEAASVGVKGQSSVWDRIKALGENPAPSGPTAPAMGAATPAGGAAMGIEPLPTTEAPPPLYRQGAAYQRPYDPIEEIIRWLISGENKPYYPSKPMPTARTW